MYAHPEIHSELARQRQADVTRRLSHRQRRGTTPGDDLGPLVEAARAGDQRAWELLVTRFTPKLRRLARSYRLSAADVDDVVQVTWASAYTHIGRLRAPEAFGGWLLVTARHASLRVIERSRRELVVDDEHLPDDVTYETPESALMEAEEREAVHAAVARLPERQGSILRALMRYSDTGYADIAARLGIPLGSIGPTRERALARLRSDSQLIAAL